MALEWRKDRGKASGDPYCDWLLGEGRDFLAHARAADQAEFNSYATLDTSSGEVAFHEGQPEGICYPSPLRNNAIARDRPRRKASWSYPAKSQLVKKTDAGDGETIGNPLVIGVIDDGVNVTSDRFVDDAGDTRIDFAWVMDAPCKGGVSFGRELTWKDIDKARQNLSDPEAPLRELGLIGGDIRRGETTLSSRISHGTHVADIAAGYAPGDPDREHSQRRRMITVQMPYFATQDTSGALYAPFVSAGLKYIIDRARLIQDELLALVDDPDDRTARVLPVIINFSYATSGGPHDGQGLIEKLLADQLKAAEQPRLVRGGQAELKPLLVLPAGNRFGARGHAVSQRTKDQQHRLKLDLRILPGDQTPNYLEIWFGEEDAPLSISITPPGGAPMTLAASDMPSVLKQSGDSASVARATLDNGWDGQSRTRLTLAIAPTEIVGEKRQPAPSGVWKIEVTALKPIKAWIQRDDGPFLRRFSGKQSYFDDPHYERFEETGNLADTDRVQSYVKRFGAMNGFASRKSEHVRVAAAHFEPRLKKKRKRIEPTEYSGAGDDGDRYRPNLSAIADRSRSQRGILASGVMPGSTVSLNGTSVAAPQLTRILADKHFSRVLKLTAERNGDPAGELIEEDEIEAVEDARDDIQKRRRRRWGRGPLKRRLKNLPERFFKV